VTKEHEYENDRHEIGDRAARRKQTESENPKGVIGKRSAEAARKAFGKQIKGAKKKNGKS
jgi:hypothetical protein